MNLKKVKLYQWNGEEGEEFAINEMEWDFYVSETDVVYEKDEESIKRNGVYPIVLTYNFETMEEVERCTDLCTLDKIYIKKKNPW